VAALEARLESARAEVGVAQARLAVAQQGLDDLEVRAPFAGVVISKDAQPGETVSPISAGGGFTRTGIATIVDMDSREIEVDVNEAYINRVHDEQTVEATLDAYPDWKVPGRVISIVPTADRQKATVRVRIAFEELDPRILPDMASRCAFSRHAPTRRRPRCRSRPTRWCAMASRPAPGWCGTSRGAAYPQGRCRRRWRGGGRRRPAGRRDTGVETVGAPARRRARGAAGEITVAQPIVCIRDLVKEYRRGAEVVRVLDGLSLDIAAGDSSR